MAKRCISVKNEDRKAATEARKVLIACVVLDVFITVVSVLNSKELERMDAPNVLHPADSFEHIYLVPSAIFRDVDLKYFMFLPFRGF